MEGCGRKIGPYNCCSIVTGDARELAEAIPDESVNLIFTDPPYLRESLHLCDWLARFARRVLTPDGFLMFYMGNVWKDDVMAAFRDQMEYFWDFAAIMRTNSSICWDKAIITRWKSLLCYRRLGSVAKPRAQVLGCWVGSGRDKRFHAWGQDESTARYYIDCFSKQADLVVDPFCGGGTTAAMCEVLARHYLAFEIDPDIAERARERVRNTQPPLFVMEPEQEQLL